MYLRIDCCERAIGRVSRLLGAPTEIIEKVDAEGIVGLVFENAIDSAPRFIDQMDEGVPLLVYKEDPQGEYPGVYIYARDREGKLGSRLTDGDESFFVRQSYDVRTGKLEESPSDRKDLLDFLAIFRTATHQILEDGKAWAGPQVEAPEPEPPAEKKASDLTLYEAVMEIAEHNSSDIFTDAEECQEEINRLDAVVAQAVRLMDSIMVVGVTDGGNLYADVYEHGQYGVVDAETAIEATSQDVMIYGVFQGSVKAIDNLHGPTEGGSVCPKCGMPEDKGRIVEGMCPECQGDV